MAAFSNHQNPTFVLDSFFNMTADTSDNMFSLLEDHETVTTRTWFSSNPSHDQYLQKIDHSHADQIHLEKCSTVEVPFTCSPDSSVIVNQNSGSPFMVADLELEGDQVNEVVTPMEQNREHIDIKVQRECKRQKQSKHSGVSKSAEKRGLKRDAGKQKKVPPELPPTGYVLVRARRGEATDSHSLAERVRRQKMSMRMKVLQSLVPGCDKISSRTFILDKIIGYVQALQNEVEFLTARLALVGGMANDFEVLNFNKNTPASEFQLFTSELHQLPFNVQSNSNQPTLFNGATPASDSFLLHQETTHATSQGSSNLLQSMNDKRDIQMLGQQYGLANLHPFVSANHM